MTYEEQAVKLAAFATHSRASAIEAALKAARADGIKEAVNWHRRQAKHMAAIIDDGERGLVARKDADRAATWRTHHIYCASWLEEGCRK